MDWVLALLAQGRTMARLRSTGVEGVLVQMNSSMPNERELYRELSKKIDNLKFVVFLLCGLMACVIWKLW